MIIFSIFAVAISLGAAAVALLVYRRLAAIDKALSGNMAVLREANEEYINNLRDAARQWDNMMRYTGEDQHDE